MLRSYQFPLSKQTTKLNRVNKPCRVTSRREYKRQNERNFTIRFFSITY